MLKAFRQGTHLLSTGIKLAPGTLNFIPQGQNGLLILLPQHSCCLGVCRGLHCCFGQLTAPLVQVALVV